MNAFVLLVYSYLYPSIFPFSYLLSPMAHLCSPRAVVLNIPTDVTIPHVVMTLNHKYFVDTSWL